jgi:hypothetical protein
VGFARVYYDKNRDKNDKNRDKNDKNRDKNDKNKLSILFV